MGNLTRPSHKGILLLANNALVKSSSNCHNTVELSTFGSELVALRIRRDLTVELRIKLTLIGVPLLMPTNVYCDNQGVAKNTNVLESTLNKQNSYIN